MYPLNSPLPGSTNTQVGTSQTLPAPYQINQPPQQMMQPQFYPMQPQLQQPRSFRHGGAVHNEKREHHGWGGTIGSSLGLTGLGALGAGVGSLFGPVGTTVGAGLGMGAGAILGDQAGNDIENKYFAHGGLAHKKGGKASKRMILAHFNKHELDELDHLQGDKEICPRSGLRSYSHLEELFKNPHIKASVHRHHMKGHHLGRGLKEIAKLGRHGDKELALIGEHTHHIFDKLCHGGSINPHTGRPEYYKLAPVLDAASAAIKGEDAQDALNDPRNAVGEAWNSVKNQDLGGGIQPQAIYNKAREIASPYVAPMVGKMRNMEPMGGAYLENGGVKVPEEVLRHNRALEELRNNIQRRGGISRVPGEYLPQRTGVA